MTTERLYRCALRAYPAAYRAEYGEEMLGTLLETSAAGPRWVLGDVVDLVLHGLQRRGGLTSDQAIGRGVSLAALPGLVMAATFSVCAYALGDEVPSASHGMTFAHFGPFATVGPAVYLTWVIVALAALVRPSWQRTLAVGGILVTVAAIPIGASFFARPPLIVFFLPAALALPAVLAPPEARARLSSLALGASLAVTAGVALVADVGWSSNAILFPPTRWHYLGLQWFYLGGVAEISSVMSYAGVAAIVLIAWLAYRRRWDRATAIGILLVPWLVAGALGPRHLLFSSSIVSDASRFDGVLARVVSLLIGALWVSGLRRARPPQAHLGTELG